MKQALFIRVCWFWVSGGKNNDAEETKPFAALLLVRLQEVIEQRRRRRRPHLPQSCLHPLLLSLSLTPSFSFKPPNASGPSLLSAEALRLLNQALPKLPHKKDGSFPPPSAACPSPHITALIKVITFRVALIGCSSLLAHTTPLGVPTRRTSRRSRTSLTSRCKYSRKRNPERIFKGKSRRRDAGQHTCHMAGHIEHK